MNREHLDAFLAGCDDVLDDWRGSADSMHANYSGRNQPGQPHQSCSAFAEQMLLYAEAMGRMVQAADRIAQAFGTQLAAFAKSAEQMRLLPERLPDDLRERALWLRQNRNTGPADPRGLDGHHRRGGR